MPAETPPLDRDVVVEQLERILSSAAFRRSERSSALLRYVVEQAAGGRPDRLKEYTIGVEVLQRGADFDPRIDPIVRAEASRLRTRLEEYYRSEGQTDRVVITLPKGGYVPELTRRPEPDTVAVPRDVQGSRRLAVGGRVLVFGLGLVTGLALSLLPRGHAARDDTFSPRFDTILASDGVLASDVGTSLALSADGRSLVFVSRDAEGRTRLNLQRLDEGAASPIAGTEGARGPFFSPDGAWIGFWADGAVRKVSVEGGAPVVLHTSADVLGADWVDDDTIVAALGPSRTLWRMSATPGAPIEAILDLAAESKSPVWPQVLPGGDLVLYSVHAGAGTGADGSAIEILSLRTGERKELVRGGTFGRYVANGYLTYVNQGTVYAVRFDPARRSLSGSPAPVIGNVSYSTTFGYAQFDVSKNGTLVYRQAAEGAPSILAWLDRTGATSPLLTRPGRYAWPAMSPQGRYLAVVMADGGEPRVAIRDLRTEETAPLAATASDYSGLVWWPAGDRLVLGGSKGMTWIDVTNPARAGVLTSGQRVQVPWSTPRDGARLAYAEMSAGTGFDIWTVPVTVTDSGLQAGTPEPFLTTPAFENHPAFSPDGRWIAYGSNESGASEVYIRRFPDDGAKIQVSDAGGSMPRWRSNGHEIVYRTAGRRLVVARMTYEDGAWRVETRHAWPARPFVDTGVLPNFDLAEGDRAVAMLPAADEEPDSSQVTIVLNFPAAVARRLAVSAP